MACAVSLVRRSVRMFVGGVSGEAANSLNLERPRRRSLITSSVHLSPKISRLQATGHGERRKDLVV